MVAIANSAIVLPRSKAACTASTSAWPTSCGQIARDLDQGAPELECRGDDLAHRGESGGGDRGDQIAEHPADGQHSGDDLTHDVDGGGGEVRPELDECRCDARDRRRDGPDELDPLLRDVLHDVRERVAQADRGRDDGVKQRCRMGDRSDEDRPDRLPDRDQRAHQIADQGGAEAQRGDRARCRCPGRSRPARPRSSPAHRGSCRPASPRRWRCSGRSAAGHWRRRR